MYIADFPQFLEEKQCKGVKLHDKWIRTLLCADDGALLASTSADLQEMLDALKEYCSKWRMFVNTDKTEIVVFNHAKGESWINNKPVFFDDNVQFRIVEEFKYLGITFHSTDHYSVTIQHRLTQGKRLLACWMRRCNVWMFKPDMVIHQFTTCVLPAIEYGVGVWYAGYSVCNKKVWESVEVFWRSIARSILGVSIFAPSGGIQGELEWYPFSVRAAWQAICTWTRITRMPNDMWTRKALCVQREMLRDGRKCWLTSICESLCSTSEGMNIWNSWWNLNDFANVVCK